MATHSSCHDTVCKADRKLARNGKNCTCAARETAQVKEITDLKVKLAMLENAVGNATWEKSWE